MPRSKPRSDVRAGLFILVTVVLIGAVIVGIKGVRSVFTPVDTRRVRFTLKDDLGGLRVGDDVRVGGFRVGTVRTIDLVGIGNGSPATVAPATGPSGGPSGGPRVVVTFTMPRKYPLFANAHLFIESSVTGTTVLNIDALGDGKLLAVDDELVGHPSAFTDLFASVGEAAPEVRAVIAYLRGKTLPQFDHVGETVASFRAAADQANGWLGETKGDMRGTLHNLNDITGTAKGKVGPILDHFNDVLVKATGSIDEARSVMGDVRQTIANAKTATAAARDVIAGNKGKLDGMIASLKVGSDNLKEATADVRRNPWRLLYKPDASEMDNLELYDAARQFSDGANHVDDAALALRDALKNPDVDRATVQKLLEQLNETFTNFHTTEQKLWRAVKQP